MTRVPDQPLFGFSKSRPANGRGADTKLGLTFGDALKSGKLRQEVVPAVPHRMPTPKALAEPFTRSVANGEHRPDALATPLGNERQAKAASVGADETDDAETSLSDGDAKEDVSNDGPAVAPALPQVYILPPEAKFFGLHSQGRDASKEASGLGSARMLAQAGAAPHPQEPPMRGETTPARDFETASPQKPAPSEHVDKPSSGKAHNDSDRTTAKAVRTADDFRPAVETARAQAPAGQPVKVSIEQAVLSPLPPIAQPLSQAISESITPSEAPTAAFIRDIPATQAHQPFKILKIELHPVELGTVTARLKAVGDALSIEIEVESDDAYHRLRQDSDTIGKQLRGLGYTVDSVTILQPATAVNATGRAETSSFTTGGRGGDGASASGGDGQSGSETGRQSGGGSDGRQKGGTPSEHARLRTDGGVYI